MRVNSLFPIILETREQQLHAKLNKRGMLYFPNELFTTSHLLWASIYNSIEQFFLKLIVAQSLNKFTKGILLHGPHNSTQLNHILSHTNPDHALKCYRHRLKSILILFFHLCLCLPRGIFF